MENSAISEIEFDEQQVDSVNVSWGSAIKEKVLSETQKFFGVVSPQTAIGSDFCAADEEDLKWQLRRFRNIFKQYSAREEAIAEVLHTNIGSVFRFCSKYGICEVDLIEFKKLDGSLESLRSCVDNGVNQDSSRAAFPSSAFFRSVAAGSMPLLSLSSVAADSYPSQVRSKGFFSAYNIIEEHIPADLDSNEKNGKRLPQDTDIFFAKNAKRGCCSNFYLPCGAPNLQKLTKRMPNSPQSLLRLTRQPQLTNLDYRAFFSYWVTAVQIIVMLFILLHYGIGSDFTSGLGVIERSGNVMTSSLSLRRIIIWEQNNVWIGPDFADLVRAGAKYTPCMRYDHSIYEQVQKERQEEAESTGCCIRLGGCYQTSECPKQFARLVKWSSTFAHGKESATRVVCGQDPRYCRSPKSTPPFQWNPTDISKWPMCEEAIPEKSIPRNAEHMHCEITGRPCCIQMHGQCRITTKEYCDFVRGSYHPNATLCSQIGWLRLSIIYFCSGIGGYLASSIFVPYMPEVGPAGSHGGVLGALVINILYNWRFLRNPKRVLLVHLSIAGALFVTGFLPYVDNWAQLVGFLIGSILAPALIPYFNVRARTRRWRLVIVTVSLSLTLLLYLLLFSAFYANSVLSYHKLSSLLNCPFSDSKVCDQQGLILKSWLPI